MRESKTVRRRNEPEREGENAGGCHTFVLRTEKFAGTSTFRHHVPCICIPHTQTFKHTLARKFPAPIRQSLLASIPYLYVNRTIFSYSPIMIITHIVGWISLASKAQTMRPTTNNQQHVVMIRVRAFPIPHCPENNIRLHAIASI